jgi:hypothetical protein
MHLHFVAQKKLNQRIVSQLTRDTIAAYWRTPRFPAPARAGYANLLALRESGGTIDSIRILKSQPPTVDRPAFH